MLFEKRLKEAMRELNLSQVQVVAKTGKSKASVSQYLSGKQVPPVYVQRDIAEALGLREDYFENADTGEPLQGKTTLTCMQAARLMHKNQDFIRKGIRNGTLPFGYAVKTSSRWSFFISAAKFSEYTGIPVA